MGWMDSITSIYNWRGELQVRMHIRGREPKGDHSCVICMVYDMRWYCLPSILSIGSVKLWEIKISYKLHIIFDSANNKEAYRISQ